MIQTPSTGHSTCIFLGGPIEYWWDTPEEPNRFNSEQAVSYRGHRETLGHILVNEGYLVYRPHEAFKGPWDERMQDLNDLVIPRVDIFVNMKPYWMRWQECPGTSHEVDLALQHGIPLVHAPQGRAGSAVLQELDYLSRALDS